MKIRANGIFLVLFIAVVVRVFAFCSWEVCFKTYSYGKKAELNTVQEILVDVRRNISAKIGDYLPSPHREFLLGLLLGINELYKVPRFNDILITTGTIHVVVVSGYNINLVFDLVLKIFGSKYKIKNLVTAMSVTFVYAVISGFEPPVIRAWIMLSLTSLGSYYGRVLEGLRVLIFTGLLMVIVSPGLFFSISFQLSFLATLSLILYSDFFAGITKKFAFMGSFFFQDLATTLSAQVLVWPILSLYFGRISILSPLVNALILWTIPIATILGGVFLITTFIHPLLASASSLFVYIFLDIFISVVGGFGTLNFMNLPLTLNVYFLFAYYIIFLIIPVFKYFFF